MPITKHCPGGLLRGVLRAPVRLYRRDLGWLLGHRFLYLVHRGRDTGVLRETVLEVVRHQPDSGEVVVVSGWGDRSQWYRNITRSPAVEIRVGRQHYRYPRQRVLDESETADLLAGYVRRHPHVARVLARVTGWPLLSEEGRAELARTLPAISFTPRDHSGSV
ncbi:deazaflavin-dependent oxidoreductase (nitroreductase family) [Actinopolyspora lacussalsi]|nr:deazaflavin-dependent oxidoreductase (nitroreductase family) [Actinopolyspora lacussalsi]